MNFKSFLILCCLISYPANAEVSKKSGFKVGDTKQSILSETQFQSIHGPEWVKLRGQVITTSKLCVKFSICTLPNAEGRFLRDSVADAGLRTPIDDTTALNDISLSGNTGLSPYTHNHESHFDTGANRMFIRYFGAVGNTSATVNVYSPDLLKGGSTTTTIERRVNGPIASGFGTTQSVGISSSSTETAPDHVVVNTFIKIN